ncbi:hypothetical protein AAF712_010272 [Marasmius tenuissimus]|uniref:Transposase n=1 Tax=Marasmius tenuissimus TaxID=585030 RepID=A0ABR2ZMC4_9AGAR
MSNNPSGKNQYRNGTKPPDDKLRERLTQYAAENLTHHEMLQALSADLNYCIKDRKLCDLLKNLNIPTTRLASKSMTPEMQETLVANKLAEDPNRRRGPNTIKSLLHQDGTPRDKVRSLQKQVQGPMAAYNRAPRHKAQKTPRTALVLLGPYQEIDCDGHEKLYSSSLMLGGVGIGIYGFRQHVGKIEMLVAVPDARRADIVGHLHLDLVEKCGYHIAVRMTVDGGSETGEISVYSPEEFQDLDEWPAFVAVPSTRNIVAEAMWSYLRRHVGIHLQDTLRQGATNGLFRPYNKIHKDLFHWLWSKIVQACLDQFTRYWNSHKTRSSPASNFPSATTPNHVMRCPHEFSLRNVSIAVDPEAVDALRERLPPRQDVFRWTVLPEFDSRAQVIYEVVADGMNPRPNLEDGLKVALRGWEIFGHMSPLLENWYRNSDQLNQVFKYMSIRVYMLSY